MEKKKKLIILGVILLLIIVSGATFAILTWNSTMIKLGINTNCFTIDYTKGGDITGSLKLLNINELFAPPLEGSDNEQFTIKKGMGLSYVNVGINSNCSIEGYGTIYLNVTELSDTFKDGGESNGALGYAVLKNTSSLSNSDIKVDNLDSQSFEVLNIQPIMETGKIELYSEQLSNTEVNKYLIVIFVDKLSAGNDITEATFKGNISVEAEQGKYVPVTPDYCFDLDKDDSNMTATIASNGYNCYAGNKDGYKTKTDINIPSIIDNYSIIGIGNGAFCKNYKTDSGGFYCDENANYLTSVIIPDTVTSIGYFSFYGNDIKELTLSKSITYIGGGAFYGNQLTEINIPDSVQQIYGFVNYITAKRFGAFEKNKLKKITIPDSVTTIGNNVFAYNNLNYVYIGSNSKLTDIDLMAFSSSNRTYTDSDTEITYVDNPNLKKIYYNGSNSLPWINAINGSDTTTKFVTGTVPSLTSGSTIYNEVLITTGK